MQTSDQDLLERITALGKVGVDQLVAYLGADSPQEDGDALDEDDETDVYLRSPPLSS
ncbi:hypothetical protein [Octadecabacter sp. R77987]|uniref:hypothetical protein n=1 Tax=Octadecabacter sp. R77987 TaxID=3093874 RepID=UPI00366D80FA